MIGLEMKNYKMLLTEKLQKYWYYHWVKWMYINVLQVKKYYFDQSKIIENATFTHSPLGKAFEKQLKTIEN